MQRCSGMEAFARRLIKANRSSYLENSKGLHIRLLVVVIYRCKWNYQHRDYNHPRMSRHSLRWYYYIFGRSCSSQQLHTRLHLKAQKNVYLASLCKSKKQLLTFISMIKSFRVPLCLALELSETGTLASTFVWRTCFHGRGAQGEGGGLVSDPFCRFPFFTRLKVYFS